MTRPMTLPTYVAEWFWQLEVRPGKRRALGLGPVME
jgi:hypothetical protein